MENPITIFVLLSYLFPAATKTAAALRYTQVFSFDDGFIESRDLKYFSFAGGASIDGGALQLTPDTTNDDYSLYNKSGRIMYNLPFELWKSDNVVASFASFFVINIFRKPTWNAGHGFAFVIAPDVSLPLQSHGQWLGLTNATTDNKETNRFVAVEFDTEKQEELGDPDENHIGLNINSVKSKKAVSLGDSDILISPEQGTNHSVWVEYNGTTQLMQVYMVKEGNPKPGSPLLNETVNLANIVDRSSYFGFAASTGQPEIQLNCVLRWSLSLEVLQKKKDWTWLKIAAGVGVPVFVTLTVVLAVLGVLYLKKRRGSVDVDDPVVLGTLKRLPGMPREFRYKDLKKATGNFDHGLMLGQGGFGIVYKGILRDDDEEDETPIAVKKFTRDNIKGKDDFLNELIIIHRLRHKHLVRLVGWCYEKGKLLLVYDFMPNGSLDKHLYQAPNQNVLSWEYRAKILRGVASSLHYLHDEFDQKVVHRDLKTSNIMLDSEFNARLGDFGLARALEHGRGSYAELATGGVAGTIGYVAPECFHTGKATPESDVFAFGAVVLEVVCGRNPGMKIPHHQHAYTLVDWVWMLHREDLVLEAVDEALGDDFVREEANMLLLLGLACSHPTATRRPQTPAILQIITGTVSPPYVPPFKPAFVWTSIATDGNSASSTVSTIDSDATQHQRLKELFKIQTQ